MNKIRKGDEVIVLTGRDKGKRGTVSLRKDYSHVIVDGINLVNRMVQAHLRDGGASLITTHGAYAAPPVRTRMLQLGGAA